MVAEDDATADVVRRRRRYAIGALIALAFASAILLQGFGYPQGSYLAQLHALADGTPRIDRYRDYSGDISYFHGHYYSNKAPGLAFATLPLFVVLRALHLPHGVHVLGLWSVLLPAMLLLVLVALVAERLEPGYGVAAAAILGIGTMILPFSSLFFAHALSSFLAFAAFYLLWRERSGRPRLTLVVAAGVLAAFATTTEYPVALVGAVLGVYALARAQPFRRGLAYCAGLAAGIVPLLLFDQWAFGSPTRLSYASLVVQHTVPPGTPRVPPSLAVPPSPHAVGHVRTTHGIYDVGIPSPRVAIELLFADRGLLRLMPVVAAGVLGVVWLYRRGSRAEALAFGAIGALFLLYDAGFYGAFGGWGPGPRYLTPALAFLAVPLAVALRRAGAVVVPLAAISAAVMVAATATLPLLPNAYVRGGEIAQPRRWLDLVEAGRFQRTVLSAGGLGRGWLAIAPFLVAVAGAVVLAAAATARVRVTRSDLAAGAVAVAGWAALALWAPRLLRHDRATGGVAGVAVVVAAAAAVVVAAVAAEHARSIAGRVAARLPAPAHRS